ncbi:hypothetical protein Csa_013371 [Cucumis sativus]|uniref:Uncharacterized protein n=1 Tax=Cucumis sativus TaxID=3659 RepID=A0A0A0LWM1_CUCSA|nr:hypothetical protein Csa_013371 [Cucumis sativus]
MSLFQRYSTSNYFLFLTSFHDVEYVQHGIDEKPGESVEAAMLVTILLDLCRIFLALPKSDAINHGFLEKPIETSEPALHLTVKYYSPDVKLT